VKQRLFLLATIISSLTPASVVKAVDIVPDPSNRITQHNPSGTLNGNFDWLEGRLSSVIFLFLGGLAVILLIWAGIQYITSAGNADQVKKARQSIIHIVLGIILLVCTYYILRLLLGIPALFMPGTS